MNQETFVLQEKECIVYREEEPEYLLIQPVSEYDLEGLERQIMRIQSESKKGFLYLAFQIKNWNEELSPWKTPPVFGKDGFGNGAADTLSYVSESLLPFVREKYALSEKLPVILGGYSLAGLFSLWSAYQTSLFDAIAAASPSVWFPGWKDYITSFAPNTSAIYLSLGKMEEKTRNRIMATVGECICVQQEQLKKQGISTILEWNEGNHFKEIGFRCAKAFLWCMDVL